VAEARAAAAGLAAVAVADLVVDAVVRAEDVVARAAAVDQEAVVAVADAAVRAAVRLVVAVRAESAAVAAVPDRIAVKAAISSKT
jgi:hypothetical protein